MNSNQPFTPDWRWGTAEGSREFDRLNDRRMTFLEKIQWLEEAEDLTIIMRAGRDKAKSGDGDLITDLNPPELQPSAR